MIHPGNPACHESTRCTSGTERACCVCPIWTRRLQQTVTWEFKAAIIAAIRSPRVAIGQPGQESYPAGANIRLFEACERENVAHLATLQGTALQTETEALAERIFSNSHPVYAMLFDLQSVDVVRIIEERD